MSTEIEMTKQVPKLLYFFCLHPNGTMLQCRERNLCPWCFKPMLPKYEEVT